MISFDEYIEICDKLDEMPVCDYIPTDEELDEIEDDAFEYLPFLVYISEYHKNNLTEEEKLRIKRVSILMQSLVDFDEN